MNHHIIHSMTGLRCLQMAHKILEPQDFTRNGEFLDRRPDGCVTYEDGGHFYSINSKTLSEYTLNLNGIKKLSFAA